MARLATEQHGVVSTRQLKRLGYTSSAIGRWAEAGRLHPVHRGVYAVGHEALSWNGRCLAAVLACRGSLASHWTAAWLWGLLRSRPGTVHLTASTRRHGQRDFVVHFGRLEDEDESELEGIPVTSLARTLLDLAALVEPPRLERLLERAEELKLLDLGPIDELLERTAGHRGHARLRRALRIYRPELALTRSQLERRFRALLRAAGVPLPASNFTLGGYELDCYWEAERFAVELDVYATHGSRRSFESDREREDDLLALGVELIRVTDVRLEREPDEVIARVAAHLGRRRSQPLRLDD